MPSKTKDPPLSSMGFSSLHAPHPTRSPNAPPTRSNPLLYRI
jgi:hypothetical protein